MQKLSLIKPKAKGSKGDGFDQLEKRLGGLERKMSSNGQENLRSAKKLINLYSQGPYQETLNNCFCGI